MNACLKLMKAASARKRPAVPVLLIKTVIKSKAHSLYHFHIAIKRDDSFLHVLHLSLQKDAKRITMHLTQHCRLSNVV